MKVKNYEISFRYQRKTYTGSVSEMQPAAEKMIRVSVETGGKYPQVFIFYPRTKDELFWYDHADQWLQGMAWKIAEGLLVIAM